MVSYIKNCIVTCQRDVKFLHHFLHVKCPTTIFEQLYNAILNVTRGVGNWKRVSKFNVQRKILKIL